ncbi:MAG TPA: GNAT family N-acetyltransferase [Candidatus Limnocylindrales bacterium]|nr:GNAT family N-acetyltransferase [Candidatus Limnocylindrales bacterium]
MPAGVVIREAHPAEHAAIGELTVQAYRGVGEGHEGYLPELRDVAARAAEVPVLVAVDASTNRLLGTATYVPGPGPYHEGEFGDVASMRMLAVAPEAQGRGVGRALVEACLARAREAGRPGMALYTRPSMASAHRLYESFGFRRVPELDWQFEPGEWLWAYRLEFVPAVPAVPPAPDTGR